MTFKEAKAKVKAAGKILIRKVETDEYIVRTKNPESGKSSNYFTDNLEDAVQTALYNKKTTV